MTLELVLCESVDRDLTTYTNVFEEVSNASSINFSLVVKMVDRIDPRMVFHVFLVKEYMGRKLGLYLQEIIYTEDENEEDINSDVFSTSFNGVPLNGPGLYSIEIVRNDDIEDSDDGKRIYAEGKRIGRTVFRVI